MTFIEFAAGTWKACLACNGTGRKKGEVCSACNGEGGIDTAKI